MTGTEASFGEALRELKRRGSALLVVGDATDDAHRRTCHGMLGAPETHRRIAVRTDGSCLDAGAVEESDGRVLRWSTEARGAAGAVTPSAPAAGPELSTVPAGHDCLRALAESTFEAVEATGDLDPGTLRLCIDSLVPVLGCDDEAAVFRFLHAVTREVRDADGICHVHLPVAHDHHSVHTLESLFDATIELDVADGAPRQRWHVAEPQITSDWLPLEDALPR